MTDDLKETVAALKSVAALVIDYRKESDEAMKRILEESHKATTAQFDAQTNKILEKLTEILDRNERQNAELLDKVLTNLQLNQTLNQSDHNKRIALWGAIWGFLQLHHDAIIAIGIAFAYGLIPYDGIEKLVLAWVSGVGASLWFIVKSKIEVNKVATK